MLKCFIVLVVSQVITFTGDILLDRGVRRQIEAHGTESLFTSGIDSVLQSSNIVVGNLECPATTIKAPAYKRFIFRAEPECINMASRISTLPTTTVWIRGDEDSKTHTAKCWLMV